MAVPAEENPSLMTEDQLLQQRISDHLEQIATAMRRMADAMEESTEPPPSYTMSNQLISDRTRPWLQNSLHDRIDAIERAERTLQIVFSIAIAGIAIYFICSADGPIPLPLGLGMLLALAVGYTISTRN